MNADGSSERRLTPPRPTQPAGLVARRGEIAFAFVATPGRSGHA